MLTRIAHFLEVPMLVLGAAWLVLLVVELVWGLSPLFDAIGIAIWVAFVVDFVLELTLAPDKLRYLKRNWLGAISLLVPALRIFRIARFLRVARAARGLRLLKIVGSVNRGLRALGASMSRRGVGYMGALTLLVTLAGSAGMYALEHDAPDARGFDSYGAALWWTLMIMTTMGSEFWPKTAEGRVLCVLMALYAFGVFGYVTAALASFFVGRDAQDPSGPVASAAQVAQLTEEIKALREQVSAMANRESRG